MKNLFKSIMFVAAAAMTFTSCSKDEESVAAPESKNITLSFSSEKPELEGTRTEHNGTTVVWSHGDKIRVTYTLDNNYNKNFYDSNEASSTDGYKTATFKLSTSLTNTSEGTYKFFTLYPSDAYTGSSTTINDAPSVPVKVADTQSPTAASFDSAADIMIGQSTKTYTGIPADRIVSLLWNRLVAHTQIKFDKIAAVDGEIVNFVTFSAENGKELTGTYDLNIETGEFTATTASNIVKLSAGNGLAMGNGQLTAWFCSLPFTTSQFTVVIDTNKATYTREINADNVLDFKKNSCNKLSIDMTSAKRVEKTAEVQLIPDGDYVIAIEGTYNKMMIVGAPTANYRDIRDLSTETIDGKLSVDGDAIWTITYEGNKEYTIKSYSENTYISYGSNTAPLKADPYLVNIKSVTGGYNIIASSASSRYLAYNPSNPRFGFYTGQQTTLQIIPAFVDTTPTISVDPAELSFPAAGGSKAITVTAKYFGEYTVSATSSNQHFTAAKEGNVVTVTAPANETDAEITGTITITVTDGTNTKTATVAVKQGSPAGGNTYNENFETQVGDKTVYTAATWESNGFQWNCVYCSTEIGTLSSNGLDIAIGKNGYVETSGTNGIKSLSFNYKGVTNATTMAVTITNGDGTVCYTKTIDLPKNTTGKVNITETDINPACTGNYTIKIANTKDKNAIQIGGLTWTD